MPVVDVPGVGRVQFPDSMSRAEIQSAVQKVGGGTLAGTGTLQRDPGGRVTGSTFIPTPKQTSPDGAMTTFVGGAGESIADNAIGLLKQAARGGGVMGSLAPRDPRLEGILANLPEGRDVLSGIDALPGILSGNENAFQEAREQRDASAEASPIASTLGDLTGDAVTLMSGRAPFVRRAAAAPKSAPAVHPPGFKRFAQQVWEMPAVQKLASGAGRAGETGLEGAALSILKDGDPLETAAYAAGGQAAGSFALQLSDFAGVKDLTRGEFLKGTGKLTLAALLVGSGIQFMESALPGGDEWLTKNLEDGYDKVLLGLLAGAGAGMAGAGRIKGENFPVLADAITSLPRGAVISLWEEYAHDEDARKAVDLLQQAPGAHTESQVKALEKGMFGDKPFAESVRDLLESDDKYREMWEAPDPRLAGVPEAPESFR